MVTLGFSKDQTGMTTHVGIRIEPDDRNDYTTHVGVDAGAKGDFSR